MPRRQTTKIGKLQSRHKSRTPVHHKNNGKQTMRAKSGKPKTMKTQMGGAGGFLNRLLGRKQNPKKSADLSAFYNPMFGTKENHTQALLNKPPTDRIPSPNPITHQANLSKSLYSHPKPNFQGLIKKLLNNYDDNKKDQFVIFIITTNINGENKKICAISKYDNGKRIDYLYYIINKCTASQRAHLKRELKYGQFTVYESSQEKLVICTNSKCYMEGEEDELNFKLTENFNDGNNTTIKYFVLPRSVEPKCTKVRYLHEGQKQCDENDKIKYATIFFNKPVFVDICKNELLFKIKESLYSELPYSEPNPPPAEKHNTYMTVNPASPPEDVDYIEVGSPTEEKEEEESPYMEIGPKQ